MNQRYLALDVFRGLTVTLMIIVNTPGGSNTFAPLLHANWHGFTLTDLVFPSFMFAVGNAMSFAILKYEKMGDGAVFKKVFKRTLLIFLIGYLMYWFPFLRINESGNWELSSFAHTRVLGVLQRIALAYGISALIIHFFKAKGAIIFSVFALLSYWLVMWAFGDYTLQGNAVLKLDLVLFGESHLYHGEGVAFDPEGLLSTLPAIVNTIGGYLAGKFILEKGNSFETIAKLMVAGAICLFVAYWWDMAFPINKKLWTSPFVLHTVGLDLLILPVLIYFIEILQIRNWTYFFEVFGKNTLFCYLLSEVFVILGYTFPINGKSLMSMSYDHIFFPIFGDYGGSLAFAISYMLLIWFFGWILDKRKIYIKI